MTMAYEVLSLVLFLLAISGRCAAGNDQGGHQLTVSNVSSTSALLHWKRTREDLVDFKVYCAGLQYYTRADGMQAKDIDRVIQYAPKDVETIPLTNLRKNFNYSCVITEETTFKPEAISNISSPCYFFTHYETPQAEEIEALSANGTEDARKPTFRELYERKAACILLGGLMPLLMIMGCLGLYILYNKCKSEQRQKKRLSLAKKRQTRSPVVQFTFGSSVELNLPTSASYFQGSEDLGRLLDEMEALLDGDFELSITEGEERLSQTKDRHTKCGSSLEQSSLTSPSHFKDNEDLTEDPQFTQKEFRRMAMRYNHCKWPDYTSDESSDTSETSSDWV